MMYKFAGSFPLLLMCFVLVVFFWATWVGPPAGPLILCFHFWV